jgi:hypothetical protein
LSWLHEKVGKSHLGKTNKPVRSKRSTVVGLLIGLFYVKMLF